MGHLERPRRIVQSGGAATPAMSPPAVSPPAMSPDLLRRTEQGTGTGPSSGRAVGRTGPHVPPRRAALAPRPQDLRDAVGRLDAGFDESVCKQLAEWIRDQYETGYGEAPVGFFAVCRLGPPYVDHQLNLFQQIVRHFTPFEAVPEPFAAARMLVRSGGYAFVEVYPGGLLLPVLDDGTVVRP